MGRGAVWEMVLEDGPSLSTGCECFSCSSH